MYHITDGWFEQARHIRSPNFNQRPDNSDINAIIIHSISMPPGCYDGDDINQFFANQLDWNKDLFYDTIRGMKVSSHLLIRRNGELVQYVDLFNRAWHAGVSCLDGKQDCNDFSIGIELEGTDCSLFEAEQYRTLNKVVKALLNNFPHVSRDRIVGHSTIAPGRKTDPGTGFEWQEFFAQLDSYQT